MTCEAPNTATTFKLFLDGIQIASGSWMIGFGQIHQFRERQEGTFSLFTFTHF